MNVLTLTGPPVTDPVRRDTTRGLVREFSYVGNPVVAQCAGGS
jgi:hypothetical protein